MLNGEYRRCIIYLYVLVWEYDLYPDISHLYCMVLIISWFGKSCFLSSISGDDIKCVNIQMCLLKFMSIKCEFVDDDTCCPFALRKTRMKLCIWLFHIYVVHLG